MKDKIINIIQSTKQFLADLFLRLDNKIAVLIPNPKIKKVFYIGVGSLFSFMLLIVILGLLLSPLRRSTGPTTVINKPNIIINQSAKPAAELTENQKLINEYARVIRETNFPPNTLSVPVIERDLSI